MTPPSSTPAAQYLRMSTELQHYSLELQSEAIARYAAAHGYVIKRSYEDGARSGLQLKGRPGLQRLLSDALRADRDFEAILVFDVSRWGRFQDLDQGAHYEFLCRSAGVPVVYCAEPFDNDGQTRSALIKQLKRLMAAEYSRELSTKTSAAKLSQARLGHRQGGPLIYGFRRVLVDRQGRPLRELERGRWKAQHDNHVILRPGPERELATIRWIFQRYLARESTVSSVTRELNEAGTPFISGRRWDPGSLARLLRHQLMIGVYVFNRRSCRLKSRPAPNPPEAWVRVRLFEPIVPPEVFARVQAKLAKSRRRRGREDLLIALRALLRRHGRLSAALIKASAAAPSVGTYLKHFGRLSAAYEAIGYKSSRPHRPAQPFGAGQALVNLRAAYVRHGCLNVELINQDPELFCADTYKKRFGSLTKAYELAGLPHKRGELVAAGRRRRKALPLEPPSAGAAG